MTTLEYLRAYIDNLLVITKGSLHDHLDKLKQVLIQLRDAGLKIKAAKSIFCAQATEYLGYILTRGGINHNQKRCRQSSRSIHPITSKNFDDSLVRYNTIGICGRNIVKCCPLSPIYWESAERQKPPKRIKSKRNLGGGSQSINKYLTT